MTSDHFISLAEAVEMTTRYRTDKIKILSNPEETYLLPNCETFDKAAVQAVLDQDECVSFRIYWGMGEKERIHAILVGVDSNGKDILPPSMEEGSVPMTEGATGIILDKGIRCPDTCPPESPLNP